ncbi:MAG TPA: hypothetical protein VGG46_11530 [Terriglobales bacterium]|jgi:hypothetical protein
MVTANMKETRVRNYTYKCFGKLVPGAWREGGIANNKPLTYPVYNFSKMVEFREIELQAG